MKSNTNYNNSLSVGIDIGGTNTVFGLVDHMGNCLSHDSIKTSRFNVVEDFVDAVCLKLNKLIAIQNDVEIIGAGIGAPNGNYFSGNIEFAPNLNWKGIIPLSKLFEDRLKIPTTLTNDANAVEGQIIGILLLLTQWIVFQILDISVIQLNLVKELQKQM